MTRASPDATGTKLVDQLFNAAFHAARDPRSLEYKNGVLASLDFRAHGNPVLRPYVVGTAQADAFWAGVDEGRAIWGKHLRDQAASAAAAPTADGA